jgi:acyl-coenzyme A synthetase/AMP-(fatty) acid ligase
MGATAVFIPAEFGASSASKNTLLTMLFTSGTTGDAKGVMIKHCAMSNAVNVDSCSLQRGERIAITANPAFDAWSFFVWHVLCRGAIAVMYKSHLADLDAFVNFIHLECIDKPSFLPLHLPASYRNHR